MIMIVLKQGFITQCLIYLFVDCFVLAIANKHKLKIYTTDGSLRRAAKKINVLCDYNLSDLWFCNLLLE